MKNSSRLMITLGVATVLGGLVTLVPAQAQSYHVRQDISDTRRDERRLDDLYRQRRREVDHRDWQDVRRIDREIADLKRRLDRDRRDVRSDFRRTDDRYRRDNDRDRYRDGDSSYYRRDR